MLSVVAHDVFWWRRTADGWRTLVTVYWPDRGHEVASSFECRLFDEHGREVARWCREVAPGGFLTLDSGGSEWTDSPVESGVLSVRVLADGRAEQGEKLSRLYGTIDWYHPTDGVVSLHSDHSVLRRPTSTELTEVVLRPGEQRNPSLVFLTADDPAPARSLELTLTNIGGDRRSATIDGEWAPNRVHRVDLTDLFGDLEAFASGAELNLTGRRTGVMTFERPYVVSMAPSLSAYHGGDRYDFAPLTAPEHFLLGEGEVNPMLALIGDGLTTEVTFFNSHGAVERDFWIAVRLYDTNGTLVAHESRWRQACRQAPTFGDLSELVPDELRPFVGHAAFTFSEPGLPVYPRRLQALMAYRSGDACARIMAWSDEWNTPKRRYRLHQRAGHYLSYYRAWCVPFIETWLGITNAGTADLTEPATCRLIVRNDCGEEVFAERTLAPLATDWSLVGELVEGANELLARSASALILVESTFDLAMVAFSRHTVSGTWSGEHFMSAPVQTAGGEVWPAGC